MDDGSQLFNVIQYSLVCPECRRKGQSAQCAHRMDLLPPWKSESRQKLVKFLLGGSEDMFLTEAMGEIASSKSRCFTEETIDAFTLHPLATMPSMHSSRTVYISIDPTSGVRSELAISSLFFTSDNCLVVRLRSQSYNNMRNHLGKITSQHSKAAIGSLHSFSDPFRRFPCIDFQSRV